MSTAQVDLGRFEEPPFLKWLFTSTTAAWIWVVPRVYFGWEWLQAGWDKVNGGWLGDPAALQGFAGYAITLHEGEHPAVNYGWYVSFLEWIGGDAASIMSPIIAVGEVLIGLALIVGLLSGIAAFFGGILNLSFGLAGSAGVNPVYFLFEVLFILAWRNVGYIGLDRWALPMVGTPWQRGSVFAKA